MLSYRHKKHTDNIPMEDFDMKEKFYICNHCGNLVTTIHNAGVPLVCCGEKMKELVPNTVEASGEKHLPVTELSGSRRRAPRRQFHTLCRCLGKAW